jgi:hypothetical protein
LFDPESGHSLLGAKPDSSGAAPAAAAGAGQDQEQAPQSS